MKDLTSITDVNQFVICRYCFYRWFVLHADFTNYSLEMLICGSFEHILWPNWEYINVKIPKDNPPSQEYAIESRDCKMFETPTVIESVGYNVRIPNTTDYPMEVKKNTHLQVRRLKPYNLSTSDIKHEYPK